MIVGAPRRSMARVRQLLLGRGRQAVPRLQLGIELLAMLAPAVARPRPLAPTLPLARSSAPGSPPTYRATVTRYPSRPQLDWEAGTSAWQFAYNPARPNRHTHPARPRSFVVRALLL